MSNFLQDVSPKVEGSVVCLCVTQDKEERALHRRWQPSWEFLHLTETSEGNPTALAVKGILKTIT